MLNTRLRLCRAINLQWKAIDLNSGKAKEHRFRSSFLVFLAFDGCAVIGSEKRLITTNTKNKDFKT